mgnify:FL=1
MIKSFLIFLIGFLWGAVLLKVLNKSPEDLTTGESKTELIKKLTRIYMDGTACDGCPLESELICATGGYENFCTYRIMEVMENG